MPSNTFAKVERANGQLTALPQSLLPNILQSRKDTANPTIHKRDRTQETKRDSVHEMTSQVTNKSITHTAKTTQKLMS
jgi:hypothetical protein